MSSCWTAAARPKPDGAGEKVFPKDKAWQVNQSEILEGRVSYTFAAVRGTLAPVLLTSSVTLSSHRAVLVVVVVDEYRAVSGLSL